MIQILEQVAAALGSESTCPPELVIRTLELIRGVQATAQAAPRVEQLATLALEHKRIGLLEHFTDVALHLERLQGRRTRPLQGDLTLKSRALGRKRAKLEKLCQQEMVLLDGLAGGDPAPLRYLKSRARLALWATQSHIQASGYRTLSDLCSDYGHAPPRGQTDPTEPDSSLSGSVGYPESATPSKRLSVPIANAYQALRDALVHYGRDSAHPSVLKIRCYLEVLSLSLKPWRYPDFDRPELRQWCLQLRFSAPEANLAFLGEHTAQLNLKVALHYGETHGAQDRDRARKTAYVERSLRRIRKVSELLEGDLALLEQLSSLPGLCLPHWLVGCSGKDRACDHLLYQYSKGAPLRDTLKSLTDLFGVIPDPPRLPAAPNSVNATP